MKKLEELTREERSLLLYLETQAVDYGGTFEAQRTNADDLAIMKRWDEEGFISFGRISSCTMRGDRSHWVIFGENAWQLAHQERRARRVRVFSKRRWLSTAEKQDGKIPMPTY